MSEDNRNSIAYLLIIIGVVLFVIGLIYKIPTRTFDFDNIKSYYGLDAYNGIIEASIRGGEIAGAKISKTIYICSGIIIFSLGLHKMNR